MDQQTERAYQKQAPVFENKKRVVGKKASTRYVKNIGLGIKVPREVRCNSRLHIMFGPPSPPSPGIRGPLTDQCSCQLFWLWIALEWCISIARVLCRDGIRR